MERIQKKLQVYSRLEQMLLLLVAILAVISVVLLICLLVNQDDDSICYTPECINAAYHVLNTVDQTVDPCEDFYRFSCGNFLKDAIARDQVSPLKVLDEKKKNGLKQIVIEELESEENLTKSFRTQRKFYKACMNTTAIEKDKDKTFLAALKEVTGGWPLSQGYVENYLHWPEIMVKAREKGFKFDYFLDVDIKFELIENLVYLKVGLPPENNFDDHLWNEANLQKIVEMAGYWGNSASTAIWELRQTIEFAKKFKQIVEKASNAMQIKPLDNEKMAISDLKTFPFLKINWLQFLKNMTNIQSLKGNDVIIFTASEEYLKDLYYLLQRTQTQFWANYIVLLIIVDECRFLSNKIEDICKEILSPSKYDNHRDYCFEISTVTFSGVAEAEYIRRVVTDEKRSHIRGLIKNLETEFQTVLKTNKWMDEETKETAVKHLKNVTEFIGWTDIVFNATEYDKQSGFDKINIESNNIIKINQEMYKLYYDSRFGKIGTNFSNYFDVVLSTPLLEVNAYYIKHIQALILMAPILDPPVYGQNRPEYMNYGSLGSIIGHELTHALSKVDDDGFFGITLIDYWSNETYVNFKNQAECINNEYGNYTAKLNGKFDTANQTLVENIADFTGLNLAYQAYQKWVDNHGVEKQLPGVKYSPNQIFWIMASTYMCQEPKLQDTENLHADGKHSVASFRVAGPIRNSPYFGYDFGCPEESGMNPKRKCRLFV